MKRKRIYPYKERFECKECAKGACHSGTICTLTTMTETPEDINSKPLNCPIDGIAKWKFVGF